MDVVLKQVGNHVGVYINKELATVFENQNTNFVSDWVEKNLLNTKISVIKEELHI